MIRPRNFPLQLSLTLVILACLASSSAKSQSPVPQAKTDLNEGAQLYKEAKYVEAAQVLRRSLKKSNSLTGWHYLGLAYEGLGKMKDAARAHENAARVGETWLENQLSTLAAEDYEAYKRLLLAVRPELELALFSVKRYGELTPRMSRKKSEEWQEREHFLNDNFSLAGELYKYPGRRLAFSAREVFTKVQVLSRPEPPYTEAARSRSISGKVILHAIFAADGQVRAIRPIKGLPHGLTLVAIRAARKIKFVPATIDGKPVNQYVQIEYNFNLY